jgi:predicted esterase
VGKKGNMKSRDVFKSGRLTAKPGERVILEQAATGTQPLHLANDKDGLLYVPQSYNADQPARLAIMLHGANGHAAHGLDLLMPYADANNIILVAPASRSYSWDIIASDAFGNDVLFINQVLEMVFSRFNIDNHHLAIGGFSDGASYALCLGLGNGSLFTHILAFSPGFYYTHENSGRPSVFISHGVHDGILPIDPYSRKIVPRLQRLGYEVNYQEFNGEHIIPADIKEAAVQWFLQE